MADVLDRPATLRLHASDPLVVALRDIAAGEPIGAGDVKAAEPIGKGHKIAARPIASGEAVRKFNQVIGYASQAIAPGRHIHTHNLAFHLSQADHSIGTDRRPINILPEEEAATFQGIVRPDGRIATRNYLGVLTTVNCSATVARHIAETFRAPGALDAFPNVDGVIALTHRTGCGMAAEGEPMDVLRRTLAGYARHPNFAGVVIVGLGCEANQMKRLFEAEHLERGNHLHSYVMQEEGGTAATVRKGVDAIREMLPEANRAARSTVSARHITVGMQCGGSDGFSAISANPALGAAADLLVRHGGTAILSETPEIYGAENILLRRAADEATGRKLIDLIEWWEKHAEANHGSLDNNPSPGNKAGGLTTILEKSLGAVAKGGTTDLVGVYDYAEPITRHGFVYMDSPGYDPVSATGQVASGANLIAFTTGRGSCFGCKPAPSIKLATNTPMYQRMAEDMDINCGEIVDGTASVQEMGERIFQLMLRIASGEKSKSEAYGYGEDEFVPWQLGATF
jgi:altronate hydrolase